MSDATDKRLSFKPYRLVLEGIQTQFDLIRFSLKLIKPKDQKQFFKQIEDRKLADIEKVRSVLKQNKIISDVEADQIANDQIESVKSQLRKQRRAGNLYAISEFSEDRLNQSELLLLVAHFESFMKLIHETFLRSAPQKVFGKKFRGKEDAEIYVREIFDSTYNFWNTGKLLNEMVTKEVKWLDSQSIEVKANYFEKYFGISFGKPKEIEELKTVMRRRNEISHEIYEPPKTHEEMVKTAIGKGKEPPLVSNPMLTKARSFFYWIPQVCFDYGAKTYQSYFKQY